MARKVEDGPIEIRGGALRFKKAVDGRLMKVSFRADKMVLTFKKNVAVREGLPTEGAEGRGAAGEEVGTHEPVALMEQAVFPGPGREVPRGHSPNASSMREIGVSPAGFR